MPDTEVIDATADHIHQWFGLTYSNYLVLPRTLLQSMPGPWQRRFVAMLEELDAAFAHIETAMCYKVDAATEHELGELNTGQLESLGIERRDECAHLADESCGCRPAYERSDGVDVDAYERVLIPCADPVPQYNRGRTRIAPRLPLGWENGHPVPAGEARSA